MEIIVRAPYKYTINYLHLFAGFLIQFILFSVLYKEGPAAYHADYVVIIRSENKDENWIQTLGLVRVANTTVKVLFFGCLFIYYFQLR